MTQLSDKIAVRDYVRARIGEDYLTRLYWTGDDLEQVDRAALPRAFVIKSNNGSGTNIIVNDKDTLDWDDALKKTRAWMTTNHSVPFAEWQYRWIKPRLLIEEFLGADDGSTPDDIKIYCFHGKPTFCLFIKGRFGSMTCDFVDIDCHPVNFTRSRYPPSGFVAPPERWNELLEHAQQLSTGLEFARIDFYCVPNIVFGEITFTPEAGNFPFQPERYDRLIYESFLSPHRSRVSDNDRSAILHPCEDV